MNPKLIAFISVITMLGAGLVFLADSSDAEEVTSGVCGENLDWSYDTETRVLTISGEGSAISDYSSAEPSPWSALTVDKVEFDCPNLTTIGTYAFTGCGMTNDKLPYKITTIGAYAFKDCLMLSLEKLPDKLTYLGNGAFEHCPRLNIMTIPYGVTTIGADSFKDCMGIHMMIIPSKITYVDDTAFDGTTGLTTVGNLSNVDISGKFPYKTHVLTYTTGSFGGTSFAWFEEVGLYYMYSTSTSNSPYGVIDSSYIANVKIAYFNTQWDYIRGSTLFNNASNLSKVYFPDTVEGIGISRGLSGTAVSYVSLPQALTSMSGNMFENCSQLTGVFTPKGLTTYNSGAFKGSGLTYFEVPSTITLLSTETFMNCTNLQEIVLNDGLRIIGTQTFRGTSSLRSITIPTTVTSIDKTAFHSSGITTMYFNAIHCSDMTGNPFAYDQFPADTVIFGDKVEYIPAYFSSNFKNYLTNIYLSESITTIGANAFSNVANLNSKLIYSDNVLGYFTDETYTVKANLQAGQTGYGAVLQSATTDVNYDSETESVNLSGISADMTVSGEDYVLDPEYMVYPNDYTSGTDGGILGTIVKLIPLFVILGVLMSLVGAYFVRSNRF